jgi:hypothetical protein
MLNNDNLSKHDHIEIVKFKYFYKLPLKEK